MLGFSHLCALFSVPRKRSKSPQKPLNFTSYNTKCNTKTHVQRTGPLFSFFLLSVNRKTANPLLSFLCSHKRFRYKNSVVLKLFGEVGRPDSSKANSLRMPRLRLYGKISASTFLILLAYIAKAPARKTQNFQKVNKKVVDLAGCFCYALVSKPNEARWSIPCAYCFPLRDM